MMGTFCIEHMLCVTVVFTDSKIWSAVSVKWILSGLNFFLIILVVSDAIMY